MPNAPVFLSGASGFVGTAVLRELLQRDRPVHAVVHSRDLKISDPRLTLFRGELDDPAILNQAMQGCSAAIHLVGIIAENPAKNVTFHRMHVEFTRAVVDACIKAGVQRYVHMSAAGTRSDAPSLYHRTKAAAEQIVQASPLSWTIFRPSLIHGPQGEFATTLAGWAKGKQAPYFIMPYFGSGPFGTGRKYLVQPVAVEDVARAFVDALGNPASIGRKYDLGGAQRLSWPDMYRTFSRAATGKEKRVFAIPAWYARVIAKGLSPLVPFTLEQVEMSQEDNIADLADFKRDFGFLPEPFEQSVTRYASRL